MQNSKVQDSMFIDMKYIILYRKLGFKEIKPDIFKKEYNNIAIIIESENQRFLYNKIWFDLKTYKDMVLIECLDRLLEKGYTHHEISISDEKIINIFKKNTLFCKVFVVDWGSDFTKALHEYQHSDVADVIIYTSRLTGGLIEFEYRIFSDMNMYNNGIFEYNKIKFNKDYCFIDNGEYINNNGFIMNKVRLSKYVGNNKKIQIPSGIKQIGAGAFWNNTVVEEIIIPQSVEIIEGDAFVYCENLKSINVPINVRLIGDNPFAGCPLLKIDFFTSHFVMKEDVIFDNEMKTLIHYMPSKTNTHYTIPKTVEWIGKHSFYKCKNLRQVILTENVSFVGNNVFSDCDNITLINNSPHFTYKNGLLYNADMTQVYHYSMGSNIKHVVIEEGTRTIGRNAFWNSKQIESITIPSTVRQIGYNPFANCINAKFINNSLHYQLLDGIIYSKDLKELVCCTDKVARSGFDLPKALVSIGRNAFVGCKSLEQINLPKNVKYISRGAFSGCVNLHSVNLSENIISIGDWAFNNCVSLENIYIPKNIKIHPNTFNNTQTRVTII